MASIPPIRSIFYAVFDAKVGPKIVYQVPENELEFVGKEYFDSIASGFIITKQDLLNKLIKVTTPKLKIVGYPIEIMNKKYDRNTLYFNMCLVFDNVSHVDCLYEGVVQKLANYLLTLEKDCDFLSNDSKKSQLKNLMLTIFHDLNSRQRCAIAVNDRVTIYLIMRTWISPPRTIRPYEVPVLKSAIDEKELATKFDVVSRKIVPFITGFNRVSTISRLSQIDETVVVRCMEQFIVLGLIRTVPLFQYANSYVPTSKITELYSDKKFRDDICNKCQLAPASAATVTSPKFKDVFRLICALHAGLNAKEWCQRNNPRAYNVDERKLIQYGLVRGLLRKINVYAACVNSTINDDGAAVMVADDLAMSQITDFERQLDGRLTLEQIAHQENCVYAKELEQRLCECPSMIFLRK